MILRHSHLTDQLLQPHNLEKCHIRNIRILHLKWRCPCEWTQTTNQKKGSPTHRQYVEQPSHTHAHFPALGICCSSSLATPFGCAARDLRWRQWHQEQRSSRHRSCLQTGTILQLERTTQIMRNYYWDANRNEINHRIHASNRNVLKDSLVTIEHLTHLFEPVSLYLRKCTCMCLSVYVISVTSDFWNISTFGFRSLLETQAWSM